MPISESVAPLQVSTDGTTCPYVIVSPEQLGHVTIAFREARIDFHVDDSAYLPGGIPALIVIELGVGTNTEQVQQLLKRVAEKVRTKKRPTRQELVVRGPLRTMDEFIKRLDREQIGDWTRQHEVETRFRKSLPQRTSGFCFSKQIPALAMGLQVTVNLRSRNTVNSEELYVSRVAPFERRDPVSLQDHDEVINDVRRTLIEPVTTGLPVRIIDYRLYVGPGLEDFLSFKAVASLQAFSETATKAARNPSDLEFWEKFIKQAHLDGALIDSEMLSAWLVEEGFEQDQRDVLIQKYESGRRFLRAGDEE